MFPVFDSLVVILIKMTNYSMQCTLQSRVSKCFLSFCLIQNYNVLTFALPSLASLCFQIFAMHKRSKLVVLATAPDIAPQLIGYKSLWNWYSILGCFGQSGLQWKKIKSFFDQENIKNWPQKLHTYGSLDFFFSAAPTAQNSPELNIRFIDSWIQ